MARTRGGAIGDKARRLASAGAIVWTAAFLLAQLGHANRGVVRDPNDVAGPLDIAYARQGVAGSDAVTGTVVMYGGFSSRRLHGEGGVALALATTRSRYPDRWVFVSFTGGRLRAVVLDNVGNELGAASASRPSARAVKVTIPKRALDNSPGYYWTAFTTFRDGGACANFCVDATKTRMRHPETGALVVGRVLHDYMPPSIRLLSFPDPSTEKSPTLRYKVAFRVNDRGFSGLKRWRLDQRVVGAKRRTVVARGRGEGTKTVTRTGAEGATYRYRVIARDRQANWRRSRSVVVTVPFDDDNPALVDGYGGTWASSSVKGSFRGTQHSTSAPKATVSYAFTGRHTAWIASGGTGIASVQVDGGALAFVDLRAVRGPRRVVFARSLRPGAHTVTITVVRGTVNVDGIAVRGSISSAPEATGASVEDAIRPQASARLGERFPDLDGLDCTSSSTDAAFALPLCPSLRSVRIEAGERARARATARPAYNDAWHGWPVQPLFSQHPIRGSFLDPRPGGYHFGIDINVRDDRPEAGAPAGRTHRVYAVEGGTVGNVRDGRGFACDLRRLEVGHFFYYHVDAVVGVGQSVRPGQMIGWTCKGQWHVHLSETGFAGGARVLVNPLHRGGKLRPYVDRARPRIRSLRFFRPAAQIWVLPDNAMWSPASGSELSPTSLRGLVDVRARVSDPQSFHGWFRALPGFYADHFPYGVRLRVIRSSNGRVVLARDVFRAGVFNDVIPLNNFFAPGTLQNLPAAACYRYARRGRRPPRPCAGRYWLHLFAQPGRPYWNTGLLPNGRYRLRVSAWDARGNTTTKTRKVTIRN